ncbi:hypothetical protein GCM10009424_25490 [Sphingomonas ursincola]|jgi:hypothetical protein
MDASFGPPRRATVNVEARLGKQKRASASPGEQPKGAAVARDPFMEEKEV